MQNHSIDTLEELEAALAMFGSDALYRGQIRNFGTDDAPKMNTSFGRNGCIPPLMLRWSHYPRFALAALLGSSHREISSEFTQALLQHYGWRSLYLDASSSAAISAWFACHRFNSKRSIELCEDCFEDPVFLVKLMAEYCYEEGNGFLYVLSKEAMTQRSLGLVDLSAIQLPGCRPRFHAQEAWLAGPLSEELPVDCIVATIQAPKSVFRSYAQEHGIEETEHLFPDTNEDPVLEFLTSMPWKVKTLHDKQKTDIKFFNQPVEFPEYHDSFRKHNPPYFAYFDGSASKIHGLAEDIVVFDVPEVVVYGFADPVSEKFPMVAEVLEFEGRHFVFEIDSLVRRPGRLNTEYLKGFAISKCENGLLSVADFVVEHPGQQMAGCGINMGWHYRIADDGRWLREVTSDDCPCDNNSTHQHHLSMLTILEAHLADDPSFVTRRPS